MKTRKIKIIPAHQEVDPGYHIGNRHMVVDAETGEPLDDVANMSLEFPSDDLAVAVVTFRLTKEMLEPLGNPCSDCGSRKLMVLKDENGKEVPGTLTCLDCGRKDQL